MLKIPVLLCSFGKLCYLGLSMHSFPKVYELVRDRECMCVCVSVCVFVFYKVRSSVYIGSLDYMAQLLHFFF